MAQLEFKYRSMKLQTYTISNVPYARSFSYKETTDGIATDTKGTFWSDRQLAGLYLYYVYKNHLHSWVTGHYEGYFRNS